jgi:23S rRNA A1618 N6-methylase RlmF
MIEESKSFKNSVLWFTTLVGKKLNLDKLYKELREDKQIKLVKSTTFYQGKLVRWGLAWSFYGLEEIKSICEMNTLSNKSNIVSNDKLKTYTQSVSKVLTKIRFTHKKNKNVHTYIGEL